MLSTILGMALITFLWRYLGWSLPLRGLAAIFAGLVPPAAFAALAASGLKVELEAWPRWVAVLVGGYVAWRGAPAWATIVAGLVVYWLLGLMV